MGRMTTSHRQKQICRRFVCRLDPSRYMNSLTAYRNAEFCLQLVPAVNAEYFCVILPFAV